MNLQALVILTVTQFTVLAQKYRKFELYASSTIPWIEMAISPNENQFIFEVNSCSNFDISFYNNGVRMQWLIMRPESANLFVETRKGPTNYVFLQAYFRLAICNRLTKFKFVWNNNGNVSLWTTDTPGWRLLVTKQDPEPYVKGFDSIGIWSANTAAWKIYQTEHSTDPTSSTCVNF